MAECGKPNSSIQYLADFHLGQRIIEKNPTCCDCDAPNPKWAITSHGVLVCIKCAGVHRSLSNVSRVRSIDGDKWSNACVKDFYNISEHKGENTHFNAVWEYYVNSAESHVYKPVCRSKQTLRGHYITLKYHKRSFHKSNHMDKNPSAPLFDPQARQATSAQEAVDLSSIKSVLDRLDSAASKHSKHSKKEASAEACDTKMDNLDEMDDCDDGLGLNAISRANSLARRQSQRMLRSQLSQPEEYGMMQTNGTLNIYFMHAEHMPRADPGLMGTGLGAKADPYVYCYQMDPIRVRKIKKEKGWSLEKMQSMESPAGEPDDAEKIKYCTHVEEHCFKPKWITEEDKKRLEKGLKPVDKVEAHMIKLSVIEELPVIIELWDYDKLSSDDLMCYCKIDVRKDLHPPYVEHFVSKELTVAKEFAKQRKYRKKGKIPRIEFYATYNKLF